jgi:hypothetical protein
MCWVALIPLAAAVVGGVMQGQQQGAAATAQASALKQNAAYLNRAANDARYRGVVDADTQRVQTQNLIGTQRAAMAGNGGVVDDGSNALIQQDTAQYGELDAMIISNNAAREAYGYEVQATSNFNNASTLKSNAKTGMMSSLLGGVVGGLGSAFSGGLFSGGSGSGLGTGTNAALGGNARLNYNQAIA